MDSKIFDYIDDKSTLKLMNEYEKKGWKFCISSWDNHHNGNTEWSLEFTSPRMGDGWCETIMGEYDEKFTEKQLLGHEATALASDFMEYNEDIVTDILRDKITQLFRENPKIKEIYKKKLKVNLEITYIL